MSTIPFWRDPVFWVTLAVLNAFWYAGLVSAVIDGKATTKQMLVRHNLPKAIHWFGHAGFWDLFILLQPVLAYATARMWPHWRNDPVLMFACLIIGGIIGVILQREWSKSAGDADAWSERGKPNRTGIIHILHMVPEIGIMLMLLLSGVLFLEMPWKMFLGLLMIVANHLLLGSHWPLRVLHPVWCPRDLKPISDLQATVLLIGSILLVSIGFLLLCFSG